MNYILLFSLAKYAYRHIAKYAYRQIVFLKISKLSCIEDKWVVRETMSMKIEHEIYSLDSQMR